MPTIKLDLLFIQSQFQAGVDEEACFGESEDATQAQQIQLVVEGQSSTPIGLPSRVEVGAILGVEGVVAASCVEC